MTLLDDDRIEDDDVAPLARTDALTADDRSRDGSTAESPSRHVEPASSTPGPHA